jgi:cholera toxin transcriptional activator
MNDVPVANQREGEHKKSDQQQAESFRCINGVPVMLMGIVLAVSIRHGFIVRRTETAGATIACERAGAARLDATLRVVGLLSVIVHSVMLMPAFQGSSGKIVRFGVFELDLAAGELRKSGAKLRLQEQPFQVLALLLERAGDVVTREELRQKLWPADTFVDFDHSLNTAVNKLRESLGDSASSPRYIETMARRGYRFIAPVQNCVEKGSVGAGKDSSNVIHPELEVPIPRRGLTRGLFALAQGMYLIFYVAALFRLHAVLAIADSFLPSGAAIVLVTTVMVTAGMGIPLRCYLLSAVGFDYQRLGEKFQRMFPFILALDQLWAVAPFLLMQKIGLGAAFAASAALLYVPFSERTLIRMAYMRRRVPE